MYQEHSLITPPPDEDVRVWRYINFTKLVSMLSTGSLYFARSDKLDDPFEGSYPKTNVILRQLVPEELTEADRDRQLKIGLAVGRLTEDYRKHVAVNCWHMNEHESAAMWKLYLDSDEGVAVQSTFTKLKGSFVCEENVFVGAVKYIDYERDHIGGHINLLSPFMHKRISFSHEREVRAMVTESPGSTVDEAGNPSVDFAVETMEHGRLVKVDLDALVERVYVAPNAAMWFKELVKEVISRYGRKFEVVDSSLSNRPVF